jgi:hypothetical protein
MTKTWIIKPVNVKSIVECDIWSVGEYEIKALHGWRWGEIFIECPEKPNIPLYNPNGINILAHFEHEYSKGKLEYNINDSNWAELEFPKDMTTKMMTEIQEYWDENGNLDDFNEGECYICGTEVWLYDEITINEENQP